MKSVISPLGATMRKFVTLLGAAALGISVANAADMPTKMPVKAPIVAPAYNWTGFYIGAAGGWGWGRTNHRDLTATPFDRGPWNIDGGILGGTIGYNWQMSQWVFGVEGDGSWAHIHKDFLGVACATGLCFTDIRALGTLRARRHGNEQLALLRHRRRGGRRRTGRYLRLHDLVHKRYDAMGLDRGRRRRMGLCAAMVGEVGISLRRPWQQGELLNWLRQHGERHIEHRARRHQLPLPPDVSWRCQTTLHEREAASVGGLFRFILPATRRGFV